VVEKKNTNRKEPKTGNVYIRLLVKLYRFLSRRTSSSFNAVVLKRLLMSKVNRPIISLNRIKRYSTKTKDKTIVIVGTVSDDARLGQHDFPALKIAALKFTQTARSRITQSGGECITFDQLALRHPTGSNTVLLRGPKNGRTAVKHFGNPGAPGSKTRPRLLGDKGRKVQRARGRRPNKGFKV